MAVTPSIKNTEQAVQRWLPRLWGFAAGSVGLAFGAFVMGMLFTDAAYMDRNAEVEQVYPYDL